MFGREAELVQFLVALGAGTAVLSGVIAWAVARRYGRRQGFAVPLLILLAVAVTVLRGQVTGADNAWRGAALGLVIAAPTLAGALIGLALSSRPRR